MLVCDKKQLKLGMIRCQIIRHEGDVDRYTLASGLHEYHLYLMICL